MSRPTIYALSTRPGRAAIGVIRVLGSHAHHIYKVLTRSENPVHRRASVRSLYGQKGLLDHALTVFFQSPKTYTGEDLLELHVHGGTAIVEAVLDTIRRTHQPEKGILVRHAENGEFSKRAFLNGRFDLTEIEGIREMIDAETESQRVSALASLNGDNKKLMRTWRERILHNAALLTTIIDFGEEHDLEETETLMTDVEKSVDDLIAEISSYLAKVRSSEVLLKGIKVTLIGPPNAGKLSLLNILANRDLAIVSSIAGTTRDVIDVPLDIAGYKVIVGDTAGIRDLSSADEIEREGIKRAKQKALLGDIALVVLPVNERVPQEVKDHLLQLKPTQIAAVINKVDLEVSLNESHLRDHFAQELMVDPSEIHFVSCLSGNGIEGLRESLVQRFKVTSQSTMSDPVSISSRAQDILENDVLYGLHQFKQWNDASEVLPASECLRQSVEGIGKITGEAIGIEEILGVVFSSFCIGK